MNVNSLAIARLYRNVLDESLAAARDTVGGDLAVEAKISDAFGASIVCEAPEHRLPAPTRKSMMLAFARAAAMRLQALADPHGAYGEAV